MVGENILDVFLAVPTVVGENILEVFLAVPTVVGENILEVFLAVPTVVGEHMLHVFLAVPTVVEENILEFFLILGATGHGCSAEGTDAAPRAHGTGALQASEYERSSRRRYLTFVATALSNVRRDAVI